jgi:hypothetical protein
MTTLDTDFDSTTESKPMMPDDRDVVCSEGLLCCDSEPGFGRIAGIDSLW